MKRSVYFTILLLTILLLLFFYIKSSSSDPDQPNNNNDQIEEPEEDELEEIENNISEEDNMENIEEENEVRLEDETDKLNLDEKIGQMIIGGIDGTTYTTATASLIHDYKLGGLIFFKNNLIEIEEVRQLLNAIKTENQNNHLPLFLAIDQEGGIVERLPEEVKSLPTNKQIGEKNNVGFAYDIGTILGDQLNAFGFNLNFAPVLDVNSNPNNPVIGSRSFSNDPEIVSKLGIKTIQGMQAENIVTAVKHFPGHGDTSVDSHLELPRVDKTLAEIKEMELIPFIDAINKGVDIVMTSHILLPKIDPEYPASMSKKIITNLLRKDLCYDGVVVTDDMTMQAITDNFDIGKAAVESVKAGTDLIIVAHGHNTIIHVFETLKKAVINGELTEERINESVRRIMKLKEEREINNNLVELIDINALNSFIENILDSNE